MMQHSIQDFKDGKFAIFFNVNREIDRIYMIGIINNLDLSDEKREKWINEIKFNSEELINSFLWFKEGNLISANEEEFLEEAVGTPYKCKSIHLLPEWLSDSVFVDDNYRKAKMILNNKRKS